MPAQLRERRSVRQPPTDRGWPKLAHSLQEAGTAQALLNFSQHAWPESTSRVHGSHRRWATNFSSSASRAGQGRELTVAAIDQASRLAGSAPAAHGTHPFNDKMARRFDILVREMASRWCRSRSCLP